MHQLALNPDSWTTRPSLLANCGVRLFEKLNDRHLNLINSVYCPNRI